MSTNNESILMGRDFMADFTARFSRWQMYPKSRTLGYLSRKCLTTPFLCPVTAFITDMSKNLSSTTKSFASTPRSFESSTSKLKYTGVSEVSPFILGHGRIFHFQIVLAWTFWFESTESTRQLQNLGTYPSPT